MSIVLSALTVYSWIIILRALASWVISDPDHPVMRPLILLTEPVLQPLRGLVPPEKLGGLDVSPILAILLLWLLQSLIAGGASHSLTEALVSARRLTHTDPPTLEEAPGLWIPLLLEQGETEDLRALFSTFGRRRIAAWLRARGSRQLSRRSRLFWSTALGIDIAPPSAAAEAVWPL